MWADPRVSAGNTLSENKWARDVSSEQARRKLRMPQEATTQGQAQPFPSPPRDGGSITFDDSARSMVSRER